MTTRKCNKCHETLPLTDFYKTGRKTDKDPNKRHYTCKECTKARLKTAESQSPENKRRAHLRRKYDISIEEYNDFLTHMRSTIAIICG